MSRLDILTMNSNCGVLRDGGLCGRRSGPAPAACSVRKRAAFKCSCCREDTPVHWSKASPKRRRSSNIQPAVEKAAVPPSAIPHHTLPVASLVPRVPPPRACTPLAALSIHGLTVEQHQRLYHQVVDDKLRFKNGQPRPYSLNLGRVIKQQLWEQYSRPTFAETVAEKGRVDVTQSYGGGVFAPLYDVDVSLEPKPPKLKKTYFE
nr:uncharacterized protein LOC133623554 [Nerophis lumbriciformis]